MKLFLGWSGSRSKETAEALSEWLPQVIQAVEPFFSPDMEKGTRWETEITQELEESMIGIICLTKENLDNKWVLYEAGALSKMKDADVCTFLLDLKPSQIERPLGMFQHTRFDKDDIWKLLLTIKKKVKESNEVSPDEKVLARIFNKFWPDLRSRLEKIAQSQSEATQPVRSDSEKLDEILELVRALTRRELVYSPSSVLLRSLKRKDVERIGEKPLTISELERTGEKPLTRWDYLIREYLNFLSHDEKKKLLDYFIMQGIVENDQETEEDEEDKE